MYILYNTVNGKYIGKTYHEDKLGVVYTVEDAYRWRNESKPELYMRERLLREEGPDRYWCIVDLDLAKNLENKVSRGDTFTINLVFKRWMHCIKEKFIVAEKAIKGYYDNLGYNIDSLKDCCDYRTIESVIDHETAGERKINAVNLILDHFLFDCFEQHGGIKEDFYVPNKSDLINAKDNALAYVALTSGEFRKIAFVILQRMAGLGNVTIPNVYNNSFKDEIDKLFSDFEFDDFIETETSDKLFYRDHDENGKIVSTEFRDDVDDNDRYLEQLEEGDSCDCDSDEQTEIEDSLKKTFESAVSNKDCKKVEMTEKTIRVDK